MNDPMFTGTSNFRFLCPLPSPMLLLLLHACISFLRISTPPRGGYCKAEAWSEDQIISQTISSALRRNPYTGQRPGTSWGGGWPCQPPPRCLVSSELKQKKRPFGIKLHSPEKKNKEERKRKEETATATSASICCPLQCCSCPLWAPAYSTFRFPPPQGSMSTRPDWAIGHPFSTGSGEVGKGCTVWGGGQPHPPLQRATKNPFGNFYLKT